MLVFVRNQRINYCKKNDLSYNRFFQEGKAFFLDYFLYSKFYIFGRLNLVMQPDSQIHCIASNIYNIFCRCISPLLLNASLIYKIFKALINFICINLMYIYSLQCKIISVSLFSLDQRLFNTSTYIQEGVQMEAFEPK